VSRCFAAWNPTRHARSSGSRGALRGDPANDGGRGALPRDRRGTCKHCEQGDLSWKCRETRIGRSSKQGRETCHAGRAGARLYRRHTWDASPTLADLFRPENADRGQKIDGPLENYIFWGALFPGPAHIPGLVCVQVRIFAGDQRSFVGMRPFLVKDVIS